MLQLQLTADAREHFADPPETAAWNIVAQQQRSAPIADWSTLPESLKRGEHDGEVLALEDRDCLTQEWPGRRIFGLVSSSAKCMYLFDAAGAPIDLEVNENFCPGGKHSFVDDTATKGFLNEFTDGTGTSTEEHVAYYRVPPPANEQFAQLDASAKEAEKDGAPRQQEQNPPPDLHLDAT